MKKVVSLAMTCATLFCFSAGASAQTLELGGKLGYATLSGDKGDSFDGAVSGGLFAGYEIMPNISIVGSWLWHKHDANEEAEEITSFLASEAIGLPALTDVRLTINQFDINGKFSHPLPPVTPYLIAGIGFDYWKVDGKVIALEDFDRTEDETFWDFAINIGGGVEYEVYENVSIGAEIVYTHIFDEFDDGLFNFLASLSFALPLGGM